MELMTKDEDEDWTDQKFFALVQNKPLLVKLKPRVL